MWKDQIILIRTVLNQEYIQVIILAIFVGKNSQKVVTQDTTTPIWFS